MKACKFLIFILVAVSFAFAQGNAKFVVPTENNVGVYKNETRGVNESSIAKVGINDRLTLLANGKNSYKIKTPDGLIGWVEKRLVSSASGKAFMFDDAEVIGYLDNPTPVYIIDAENKDASPIKLDRSFADALKQNVDREALGRIK